MAPQIWIWLTLLAVISQSARTAGQKQLTARLDAVTVALVRYLFGLPFIALYLVIILSRDDASGLPDLNMTFVFFVLVAAVAQIVATVLMLRLFHFRNFAVGITYVRSETFLTALVGVLLFSEVVAFFGWIAIILSVIGVMVLNIARQDDGPKGWSLIWNKSAAYGLSAGLLFAFTSLSIRSASLSLTSGDFLIRGATTLLVTVILQIVVMAIYFGVKRATVIAPMLKEWKLCTFIGFFSGVGSIGWFTAFTVQTASYVKALSQVELILAIAVSSLFFKEKIRPLEFLGVGLIGVGVLFLALV